MPQLEHRRLRREHDRPREEFTPMSGAADTKHQARHYKTAPDTLDASMTRSDIVEVLERLTFHDDFRTIKIDGGVRDFLLSALRRKS
jgi:hypothetical protein